MINLILAALLVASPTAERVFVTNDFKMVKIGPTGTVSVKDASIRDNSVLMPNGQWLAIAKARQCQTDPAMVKQGGILLEGHIVRVPGRRIDSVSQLFTFGDLAIAFCGTSSRTPTRFSHSPFHSTGDVIVIKRGKSVVGRYQLSPSSPVFALCED